MFTMIAQAMLEKGLLDGAASSISNVVYPVASVFQERPWLAVVVAVVVFLLIFRRRR